MPTDRFGVEWWVERVEHVKSRVADLKGTLITQVISGSSGQRLSDYDLESDSVLVHVEIPINIQAIRKSDLPLAIDWRRKTREIFETYFERGYLAVNFDREESGGAQHNLYTLWQPPADWLAALTGAGPE
jgi:predicted GNAT superfamily acetyltransferase